MKSYRMLFLYFLAVITCDVKADVMLSQYDQVKNTAFFKPYINGIGTGYFWANVDLDIRNTKKLFCTPQNLDFNADDYVAILNDQINYTKSKQGNWPIGALLLEGLRRKYPCK